MAFCGERGSEVMDTFAIKYNRAHASAVEFNTSVDSEYTAHEQRSCLQSLPRNSWTLEFEKTPTAFEAVRSFFIAQKGKFKAFNWTYDGTAYIVRFDTDKLDFKVNELKYKTFTVPIVQVLSNE